MSNVRPIFRDAALKYYIQNREKIVLPRFVSPPVFLLLWLFFLLFIVSSIFAWNIRVPMYLASSGFVAGQDQTGQHWTSVVLFIPASAFAQVQNGQSVLIQLPAGGPQVSGTVTVSDHTIHSPADISGRFGLPLTTVPVGLAVVSLNTITLWQRYGRSLVSAQIHVSSRRVLSFVPGLDRLVGA